MIRFRLNATTHQERYAATALIEKIITEHGGFILDHHLYSNISTVLQIELPANRLKAFIEGLRSACLSVKGEMSTLDVQGDIAGTLQITFVHDDPDIRHEVPAVPG